MQLAVVDEEGVATDAASVGDQHALRTGFGDLHSAVMLNARL